MAINTKKQKSKASAIKSVIYPLVFGVIIITLWQTQVLHKLLNTDTLILPLPTRILEIIKDNFSTIWENTSDTLIVVIPGLIAGSIIGYLLAVFATHFPRFGTTGLTIIAAISAVPTVALAAVMLQWTRDVSPEVSVRSYVMKTIIVTIVSTASMTLNAYRGLTELKPFSLDLMKSYAASKTTVLFKLRAQNSIPYIFTSLKVSVPASIIAALVSEYFAEEITGVGRQIRENILKAQYSTAWSYIAIACIIGIVMFGLVMLAESILMRNRKGESH